MLLKKLNVLHQTLKESGGELLERGLPFIETLKAFSLVVESCFGVKLQEGYKEHIQEFKKVYLDLGISVTPKVICVFL